MNTTKDAPVWQILADRTAELKRAKQEIRRQRARAEHWKHRALRKPK